ncbi:MAG: DUF2064 domain-containing protein [Pseudomonadota bacterium]
MKCAIAIFAKTVGLSPVKTRLAADIGTENAEAFYKLSVQAVKAIASDAAIRNADMVPHWVLAEEGAVGRDEWRSFPAIWTGEGGLGKRLANVSEQLFETHDAVMFVGTDSPQLQADRFLDALAHLQEYPHMHVAGPAVDGGFYLFGSTTPVHREIWEAVTYSADTTLDDLETRIEEAGGSTGRIDVEQDVDTLKDLEVLKTELQRRSGELLPEQIQLLRWVNDYFEVAV